MCAVSGVMQTQLGDWIKRYNPAVPFNMPPLVPAPTQSEIAEFRKLLERARKYDREHNEPDCEMAEKRQKLLDLAKELGVDISFVNEAASAGS